MTDESQNLQIQQLEARVRNLKAERIRLLDFLAVRFGDELVDAVRQYRMDSTVQAYRRLAETRGSNGIEDLIEVLWTPLVAQGMQYTMEKTENGYQAHCTKCPIHDEAIEMQTLLPGSGAMKWFHIYNCSTDPSICEGFNPQIGFSRSKTLMDGADCCNHRYYIKED